MESLCESLQTIVHVLSGQQALGPVKIAGWVRTKRGSKKVSFIQLNDGSCANNIQIVCDNNLENYNEIDKITTGVSLMIEGELVQSQGQGQAYEILAQKVEICGWADPEKYPIQKKEMTYEYLREISHLRMRTALYSSIFRIRGKAAKMVHDFFEKEGFLEVQPPIFTASDCEGAGEVFQATTLLRDAKNVLNKEGNIAYENDFFGKPVFLTVSGQMEAELMMGGLGKVYTFAPSFRAENSNTPRHLAEFWHIEPEMAFWNLCDTMSLGERLIQYVAKRVLEECNEDLEIIVKRNGADPRPEIQKVLNKGMIRISFYEAMELLAKSGKNFEFPVGPECELQTEHEKYLCQHFDTLVGVYNYPADQKSFYMYFNDDGKTVAGADILVPGVGELIGSSQREHRLDVLLERMKKKGLNPEDYKGYLQTREFGTIPHSGFGIGFDRLLMWLTGMGNIRDVIAFPRSPKNCQ